MATNKQIEKEHKKIFDVFHHSITHLRYCFGWTSKELNKHIKEHFKILDKNEKKSSKKKNGR